jgi:hypothetical protein
MREPVPRSRPPLLPLLTLSTKEVILLCHAAFRLVYSIVVLWPQPHSINLPQPHSIKKTSML